MHANNPDVGSANLNRLISARKTRIIGITALALLVVYSITGFFVLPYYIKKIGMEKLSEQSGRRVIIDSVSVNPYTFSVAINGFDIKENDGQTPFISFNKLYANMEVISVLKGGPVVREIKLEKPHVHLVRIDANSYNFSDIMNRFQAKPQAGIQEKPGKPLVFSVSNIQILNGDVNFDDRPAATKHEIAQINLSIPFISNLPTYIDTFVQPLLSASINGTPMNIKGVSKVFADSRETSLDIDLKDIDIPYYLAYAPTTLNVKVPSGRLDVLLKATYHQYNNRAPMIVLTGESRIRDLRINLKKNLDEFLKVPLLSIKDISFDLEARKIEINAVSTNKGWLAVSRAADGRMNYDSLMSASSSASTPATREPQPAAAPWIYSLKSLSVDDYTVKVTDNLPAEPFGIIIDKINCTIQNITTEKNARGTVALSMRVDQKGSISFEGGFALDPLFTDLAMSLKNLRIKPIQPYLSEQAQVILSGGTLNMSGRLTVNRTENEKLNVALKGRLRISKFSMLDKANTDDLLKWDSFSVDSLEVRYSPLFVHIKEIALSNFYSRIFINADRTMNLQEIVKAPARAEDAGGSPRETPPATVLVSESSQTLVQRPDIRIDTITLRGGTINFTDESIRPRFTSNIFELAGRVAGLSSKKHAGEIKLKGTYDRYAPLEITGKINPFKDNLFVDLKADFKDMDLTSVSPYAGRYAGYTIEKGKLSFQLEYLVEKNKLNAKNNVFLDQFTFGDRVESPEATKLPVRLAVSLLKDRRGEIRLDIPVSGELSDPKFSIGGLILKVIVNLLAKAATSPFALLGAVFGGGDQLGYAEFEYGSAALTEASIKKLDILEKALSERPALEMDIEGHADPLKDLEGLKQNLMLKRVKAQKIRDLAKTDNSTSSLESIVVTPGEYPEYLKRAYKAEKFPKPRNIIGMAKDLPVPEMEKLMLTNLKVSDDDLKALAAERARAVRDYLLQSKQVEPERIFMIETKTLEGGKIEGAKSSRTDFKLK
jgi:hypothetical protein